MKSQSIIKGGAAIGGAVALLLISALWAPPPALAADGKINASCKLSATSLEPRASGHVKLTAFTSDWFYDLSVTVSCKGLTPGEHYYVYLEAGDGFASPDGFASRTGALVLGSWLQASSDPGWPRPACHVSVYSDYGLVLEGYL